MPSLTGGSRVGRSARHSGGTETNGLHVKKLLHHRRPAAVHSYVLQRAVSIPVPLAEPRLVAGGV